MHNNSMWTNREITESGKKQGRREKILDIYEKFTYPLTDRQVAHSLFGFSADMNTVRPRITELLNEKDAVLYEMEESVLDPISKRPVRKCILKKYRERQTRLV